jgi:hypothetical protein
MIPIHYPKNILCFDFYIFIRQSAKTVYEGPQKYLVAFLGILHIQSYICDIFCLGISTRLETTLISKQIN